MVASSRTQRDFRHRGAPDASAHHLAGPLGAAIAARLFELDWITRGPAHRSVRLTSFTV